LASWFLITARHGWCLHQPFYKFNPTFHSNNPAGEDTSRGDGITETLEIFLFGFSFILLTALHFFLWYLVLFCIPSLVLGILVLGSFLLIVRLSFSEHTY
jgi:hypothetical protein